MTKYERAKKELEEKGTCEMTAFGNSMMPILKSGSKLTFEKRDEYKKGDIVLSRVGNMWIDAHKITKVSKGRGYLISNNHGHDNGWTNKVYGKVVKAVKGQSVKTFK